MLAGTLLAESRKELHFTVGPKAGISVSELLRLDLSEALVEQHGRRHRRSALR